MSKTKQCTRGLPCNQYDPSQLNKFTANDVFTNKSLSVQGDKLMGALISDCQQYRYWLTRTCDTVHPEKSSVLFVMLNPSTADAEVDDPTIRRCKGFAKKWNFKGLTVANLYALRSTSPKHLWQHTDPVGSDNDYWLKKLAVEHTEVVCAWGANAKPERVNQFIKMMTNADIRLWCLGATKTGAPRHPLYVKADQPLVEFNEVHL
ncbi:DUF1643 domain-containing protein [Spartinivicinus marinus]|nr:DUF1643 domain-containing protein [Spartinivicinus marinus]